ncbi:MAG: ABC transporter permease [Trebonia sp.]|uniref:ABC transporter permease n=1 Tax=Trebonia sp. TaxID=2767075 RepID=UPI003BDD866A
MTRLIVKRLLWSVPLLLIASALSFVLLSLASGNPAAVILGPTASAAQLRQLTAQLGLNAPVWVQYWHWLDAALHGNLGTSLIDGQPVTTMLAPRVTISLTLVLGATLLASVLGVTLGVLAAIRGGPSGRVLEVTSVFGFAIPDFVLGLVLIEALAVAARVFPASGFVSFFQSPDAWLKSLVLPWTALGLGVMTIVAVQTRDAMREALRSPFIRVLEANGISRRSVLFKHALRSAAIPLVTVVGIVVVALLGGSVLIESVFALPGLGSALATAATQHDIPVVQGVVLYFTLIVVAVNLLLDVVYGQLNPRVRAA